MKRDGRLADNDWASFNGKTRVAFQPKQMTPAELFSGYMWFRRQFYSYRSMFKRMAVSRTNLVYNLFVNLGYKWSLQANYKMNSSITERSAPQCNPTLAGLPL